MQHLSCQRSGQGFAAYDRYVNAIGVEVLIAAKHLTATDWYLTISLPTEEAFAPIYAMNKRHLLSALLFTLLAGALTWWLMRRQFAPLFATVHTLTSLTDTDRPIPLLPVPRQDEIGLMIESFNRLLANLVQRTATLAESSARFERAVSGANDGIWDWIPAAGEAYLSPRWNQLLGYADHELPSRQESFFNRIHSDDLAKVQEAIRANFEERKPFQVELRLRCKSGEYRWFSSRGHADLDDQGQPRRMAGPIADITERKQAEAALQATTAERLAEQAAALDAQRQARLAALNLLDDARAARAQAEAGAAALAQRNEQLSRFNKVTVGRELAMIGLKRQVNALARELGRAEPYKLAFLDAPPAAGNGARDSTPPAAGAQQ